jgi:hypothetical protein
MNQFTGGKFHPEFHVDPAGNFFARNPNGKVEVKYLAPHSAGTLLETVANGEPVAEVAFVASQGGERATFRFVKNHHHGGGIAIVEFKAEPTMPYMVMRQWNDNGRTPMPPGYPFRR